MKELNYKIELTDQQFDLLIKLKEKGWAEYRDTQYDTLDEFKDSDDYKVNGKSEEWFMSRNFDGTYKTMMDLIILNLVDDVEDAWHSTYKISDFGKEVLKQNGLF